MSTTIPFILDYAFDSNHIIAHDRGLPPYKSRKISFEEFDQCYAYEGANQGASLFKKNATI